MKKVVKQVEGSPVEVRKPFMSWSLFWFLAVGGLLCFVPLLGAGWLAGGLFLLYVQDAGRKTV